MVNTKRELQTVKKHQIYRQLYSLLHLPQDKHANPSFRRLSDNRERMIAVFNEAKANSDNEIRHVNLDHFIAHYEERNLG